MKKKSTFCPRMHGRHATREETPGHVALFALFLSYPGGTVEPVVVSSFNNNKKKCVCVDGVGVVEMHDKSGIWTHALSE